MKRNPVLSVCMLGLLVLNLCQGACSSRYSEIEHLAQQTLAPHKELYVIALQTGQLKLPKGGRPHVTHPGAGGVETPMPQVWLVNGGYLGEIYECRGCDSCMHAYRQAGLIDYRVEAEEADSVLARVRLTEKGSQYLAENYLEQPHSILYAWRRRLHIEMMVVAQEHFDIDVQPTDTVGLFQCTAQRSLHLTPFLKALGGTEKDPGKDYVYTFRLDATDAQHPRLTDKVHHEP